MIESFVDALAEALGTSPRLWMNLQATFDLAEAVRRRKAA
jgi:plasmid maintenance system antidote protein VapI